MKSLIFYDWKIQNKIHTLKYNTKQRLINWIKTQSNASGIAVIITETFSQIEYFFSNCSQFHAIQRITTNLNAFILLFQLSGTKVKGFIE